MDNNTKPSFIERAQADLDRVEENIRNVQDKIAILQANLDKNIVDRQRLTSALEIMRSYSKDARDEGSPSYSTELPRLDKSSPMYGKSLLEAAVYLSNEAKRPLTGKEIVKKMQDAGVVLTMSDPVMNANLTLNKRKDLVTKLKGGRWIVVSADSQPEQVESDTGCVRRVSDDEHYAKTLAGLAAARARGVHLGRKPVMTDGKDKKARELLRQGMPPAKVAQEIGISRSAIYRFIDDNNIERKKYFKVSSGNQSH